MISPFTLTFGYIVMMVLMGGLMTLSPRFVHNDQPTYLKVCCAVVWPVILLSWILSGVLALTLGVLTVWLILCRVIVGVFTGDLGER